MYNRIDGHVIFEWIEKYLHERFEEVERIRINEKRKLDKIEKESDKAVPMPDFIKELIVKKKPVVIENKYKVLNQTEQQKKINEWSLDFDLIWEKQGSNGGKKIILTEIALNEREKKKEIEYINMSYDNRVRNGEIGTDAARKQKLAMVGFKKMDISEYLQYRFNLENKTK